MDTSMDPELWVSSEESEPKSSGNYPVQNGDPKYFRLDLVPRELLAAGVHNRSVVGGEQQETVASESDAVSKWRSAFYVGCEAKVIVHGTLDSNSMVPGSLLIYDFQFVCSRSTRVKTAYVELRFQDQNGQTARSPTVQKIAPYSRKMIFPQENNVATAEKPDSSSSAERHTSHPATITGANVPDEYGYRFRAGWALQEDNSKKARTALLLRACILLKGYENNAAYQCIPTVTAEPDFKTRVGNITSSRPPTDPIKFDTSSEPYNKLENLVIDPGNLREVDLESLWSCSFH